MTVLEDIFVTTRIIAFERYNFICRKQKKTESLEQFYAHLNQFSRGGGMSCGMDR